MAEAVTKLAGDFAGHASATITYSRGASGVGGPEQVLAFVIDH